MNSKLLEFKSNQCCHHPWCCQARRSTHFWNLRKTACLTHRNLCLCSAVLWRNCSFSPLQWNLFYLAYINSTIGRPVNCLQGKQLLNILFFVSVILICSYLLKGLILNWPLVRANKKKTCNFVMQIKNMVQKHLN